MFAATLFNGCGGSGKSKSSSDEGGVKEFTAFFAVPGSEINDDNEIQEPPDPSAAACQLVALPLVLCGADRSCPAGGGGMVWNRVTEVQPDYTVARVSRNRPGHCLSQPAGDPAGSPCRGRERRWQGKGHGKGHLAGAGL